MSPADARHRFVRFPVGQISWLCAEGQCPPDARDKREAPNCLTGDAWSLHLRPVRSQILYSQAPCSPLESAHAVIDQTFDQLRMRMVALPANWRALIYR